MSVIWLGGNLSEGYTAHGPYAGMDEAADAHDNEEGWLLTLDTSGALYDEIKAALEGDSNDAEHDALVSVAEALRVAVNYEQEN